MSGLSQKTCIPCQGGVPPIDKSEASKLKEELHSEWEFTHEETRLKRSMKFKDFKTPFEITKEISELAEEQWHHPEISLGFGHLEIEIWTHKINNLVESDFIFAAKCDQIIKKYLEA